MAEFGPIIYWIVYLYCVQELIGDGVSIIVRPWATADLTRPGVAPKRWG
jgi:hypothetical protein